MDKQEIKVVINEALTERALRDHQQMLAEQAGGIVGSSGWTEEQIGVIANLIREARTQ